METENLIEQLAGALQPVKRLRPAGQRAALWLLGVAALSALLILRYADWTVFFQRIAVPRIAVEFAATGLTGIAAVLAAFMLSVPGTSPRWAALPVPPFLLWLASSGLGCLRNGLGIHAGGSMVGESGHCFLFIVGVSVPLAIALFAALRRARPIAPLSVAALGTLGVAAIAAFVLEFFHNFDVTVIDLSLHLAAVGLVVLIGTALRRPLLAGP